MSRRYSENIAGLFAIGAGIPLLAQGWCILISLPAVLFYLLIGLVASISGQVGIFGFVFLGLVTARISFYIFDIRLVGGYIRHFRGNLDQKAVDRLWIKTIIWNGIFFFPSAFLNLRCWLAEECYLGCRPYGDCNWLLQMLSDYSPVFICLTIWWGIATFVPFLALASIEVDEPLP
jgi:hypothetical protein